MININSAIEACAYINKVPVSNVAVLVLAQASQLYNVSGNDLGTIIINAANATGSTPENVAQQISGLVAGWYAAAAPLPPIPDPTAIVVMDSYSNVLDDGDESDVNWPVKSFTYTVNILPAEATQQFSVTVVDGVDADNTDTNWTVTEDDANNTFTVVYNNTAPTVDGTTITQAIADITVKALANTAIKRTIKFIINPEV
jgi:hypothetical protein